MWLQFFLENVHFAINLFAALVFFAVFWLYYDAWSQRKITREIPKLLGFLFLSLSFVVHATHVETVLVATPLFAESILAVITAFFRLGGYILLLAGHILDPLEPKPSAQKHAMSVLPYAGIWIVLPQFIEPVLAACVGFLYLRRATVGLEDHLKSVAYAFFILSFGALLHVASVFADTSLVSLYKLVSSFGVFWILSHATLLVAMLVLRKWVFGYLLKQFETQLFMIFTSSILVIFLITTVSFTGLLVKNMQDEALRQLETDVQVLSFAIDSQKAQLLSDVQVVAQNEQVIAALSAASRKVLSDAASSVLLTKKASTLVIVSETGQVVARGENRDRVGDSLSDDPLIKRALLGETVSSVVTRDGVIAPEISLRAATPVRQGATIIGAVMSGVAVDHAFVDGVKSATGLDASIYADNIVSATTFVTPDGNERLTGLKEQSPKIKTRVLSEGKRYIGTVTIAQVPHFAAFLPLKDVDTNPVGMLFVGRPEATVLQTAGRSIELTFLVTTLLLLICVIPAQKIARSIADQI